MDTKQLRKDLFQLRDALFAWLEYADLAVDENTDDTLLDRHFQLAIKETVAAQGSRTIAEFLGSGEDLEGWDD